MDADKQAVIRFVEGHGEITFDAIQGPVLDFSGGAIDYHDLFQVGHVDVFIHDSLHTAKNTLFEMERAASAMRAGGVMLIDDIKSHLGFATFAKRHPEYRTIVCETDDKIGMFGVAVNGSTALAGAEV